MKCLYKYKPLVDKDKDGNTIMNPYTKSLLENGELYFSKPSEFNDPFDSYMHYDKQYWAEEAIEYFSKKNPFGYSQPDIVQDIKDGRFPYKDYIQLISGLEENFRIYCFSKTNTNILMWSHYAKDHTGICIGFKTEINEERDSIKIKTEYFNNRRDLKALFGEYLLGTDMIYPEDSAIPLAINPFNYNRDDVFNLLHTKSHLWKYEEEVRMLLPHDVFIQDQKLYVNHSEIAEICFGLRTPQLLKDEIINMIRSDMEKWGHVTLFQAKNVYGKYEIELKPITI